MHNMTKFMKAKLHCDSACDICLWQKPGLKSEKQVKATKGVELTTDHKWTPSHAVKTYSSCTELPHHHQTTLSNTFRSPASGFSVSESSSSYKTRIYRIKLKEQAWQVTELTAKGIQQPSSSPRPFPWRVVLPHPLITRKQVLQSEEEVFGFWGFCRQKHHSAAVVPTKLMQLWNAQN